MKDREFMYVFNWSQDYPELQDAIDKQMDVLLEISDYKEANDVINLIKNKL